MGNELLREDVLAALSAAVPESELTAVEQLANDSFLVTAALAGRGRRAADEALRMAHEFPVELPNLYLSSLERLVPGLTSPGRRTALAIVEEMLPINPRNAARALVLLAPHLTATEREMALALAGRLDGAPYVTAMVALADGEGSDLVRRARAAADDLPTDSEHAEALLAFARFPEYRQAALDAALNIQDDLRRSQILARVAPYLDACHQREALAAMLRCYAPSVMNPPSPVRATRATRAELLTQIAETAELRRWSSALELARAVLDVARWWS